VKWHLGVNRQISPRSNWKSRVACNWYVSLPSVNIAYTQDLQTSSIEVIFGEEASDRITFAVNDVVLRPGPNTVTATCDVSFVAKSMYVLISQTSCRGLYALQEARIHLGNVTLAYPSSHGGTKLQIHRNPAGPRTVLRMPFNSELLPDSSDPTHCSRPGSRNRCRPRGSCW